MQMFKGMIVDILAAMDFSPDIIASRSIRYSAFLVGHTTFGFVVYFHLILFIVIVIAQTVCEISVFVLVFYLLIIAGISLIGRWFLVHTMAHRLILSHEKFVGISIFILGQIS